MEKAEVRYADVYDNIEVVGIEDWRVEKKKKNLLYKTLDIIGFQDAEVIYMGQKFKVAYTKEQADKLNIPYKHWKDVRVFDLPAYVLFADNWVGLCFKAISMQWTLMLVTPIGDRMLYRKASRGGKITPLDPYFDILNAPVNFDIRQKLIKMPYNKKLILSQLMAKGCTMRELSVYFFKHLKPAKRKYFKTMMESQEVKAMATDAVKQALDRAGLSEDYVIEMAKNAEKMAIENRNVKALVDLIREVAEWTGFHDKNVVKTSESAEMIDYEKDLLTAKETEKSIKLVKKTEE